MRGLIRLLLGKKSRRAVKPEVKRFKAPLLFEIPRIWKRRLLRTALFSMAAGATAFGAVTAWKSAPAREARQQIAEAVDLLAIDAGLVVRRLDVVGLRTAGREEIITALDVDVGTPFLAIDPAAIRRRLEGTGWVDRATVERRFDGTLVVHVVERVPLALWQSGGAFRLIDRRGNVITGERLDRFSRLPLVVGAEAAEPAAGLIDALASKPGLAKRVSAAVRVGGRRWTLRLDNGIEALLPETGWQGAIARLARLIEEKRLLDRAIVAVDLRIADRLVLRLAPDAAWRGRGDGQAT